MDFDFDLTFDLNIERITSFIKENKFGKKWQVLLIEFYDRDRMLALKVKDDKHLLLRETGMERVEGPRKNDGWGVAYYGRTEKAGLSLKDEGPLDYSDEYSDDSDELDGWLRVNK